MRTKIISRIDSVEPNSRPLTLRVLWRDGGENLVDLSGVVNGFRVFAPRRDAPGLFAQVKVGDQGTDIMWTDDIDMADDTLWRLAREQSGATMTADAFQDWRRRHVLTLDGAARPLGPSRRTAPITVMGKSQFPASPL